MVVFTPRSFDIAVLFGFANAVAKDEGRSRQHTYRFQLAWRWSGDLMGCVFGLAAMSANIFDKTVHFCFTMRKPCSCDEGR